MVLCLKKHKNTFFLLVFIFFMSIIACMNIDFLVFFETVKDLAKKKNMTIEMMIQSIEGLSFNSINTYNSMRKAQNLPRADDVLRIAKFFGVSVEYLVTGKEPDNSSRIAAIREQLKAIDDELQKM